MEASPSSAMGLLWDRANPNQQEIVAKSDRFKDVFKRRIVDLREFVDLPQMLPHLLDLDVIDRQGRDRILLNATPGDATERLVEHIARGTLWRFHSFLRALALTNQQPIITLLGLNSEDYEDSPVTPHPPSLIDPRQNTKRKQHFYRQSQTGHKIEISQDLLPGILQHSGSYIRTLMKTTMFGYKEDKPIDLTDIYICNEAFMEAPGRDPTDRIFLEKEKMFLKLSQRMAPNCMCLEGPAGAGKSCLLEEYAYDWSRDFQNCEQKGPDVPCEGHRWKMVVCMSAAAIRGTAVDAIRDHLKCERHLKQKMMDDIEDNGEGVLIIGDGMDELRNQESIESLKEFTKTSQEMVNKPKVLLSARDNLLPIKQTYFDRSVKLEGFSLSQGLQYIEKYFKQRYDITDHPVLDYVRENPEDLKWILKKPLRLHILSELTACGFLKVEDVKTLTTVKLFRSLDELILKRDSECRQTPVTSAAAFYEVCLRCLLTDERIITDDDITRGSTYLSLLTGDTYMDQDFNDRTNYRFPHEMLFEFYAVRGLIQCLKADPDKRKAVLLYLCSKENMRNVILLACGFIAQYERHLLPDLVFIIRACMILHERPKPSMSNELIEELVSLQKEIQESFPTDVLSNGLTPDQVKRFNEIFTTIQRAFPSAACSLREMGWFLNGYELLERIGITALNSTDKQILITSCLQQCSPEQQVEVCRNSTHRLLPCAIISTYLDIYALPVKEVRWTLFVKSTMNTHQDIKVAVWCLEDLNHTLKTWSLLPKPQYQLLQWQTKKQDAVKYQLFVAIPPHLGPPLPADPWSEDQWSPGLTELLSPKYCATKIMVTIPGATPLSGMQSAFRKIITQEHGVLRHLYIQHGTTTEDELLSFCSWAVDVKLRITLHGLEVTLRPDRDTMEWKDVDSEINRTVKKVGGRVHSIAFLAADGKKYTNTERDLFGDNPPCQQQ